MDSLKICFVASEIVPFAKTGGLADVMGALGKYLDQDGYDIKMVMPFYSSIETSNYDFHLVEHMHSMELWMGTRRVHFSVLTTKLPGTSVSVYFIHCPELFNRWSIYTNDTDEYLRFAMLSRAALEIFQLMGWSPDIIHANDWQTALIPVYLKTIYAWDKLFQQTKTVLTIHNIGYQGDFDAGIINDLGLADYYQFFDAADLYYGRLNFLKSGVTHADKITTVSENYAKEIQTDYYGDGLQKILRNRKKDLVGILNGVDYEEWHPKTDPYIEKNYSSQSLSGKAVNKKLILEEMGLGYDKSVPLLGMVTRLTEQKGIDLFFEALPPILQERDVQFIVLGSGEARYEYFFGQTQHDFPERFVFYRGYNYKLSHMIEAGADIFVMPSRYEPCGLNQIYSLKYGTVPIVRKTGGLADTVDLYDWESQKGTGFVFEDYSPAGLSWALNYAIDTFAHRKSWNKLMRNGMKLDFSWKKQVKPYIRLYKNLSGKKKKSTVQIKTKKNTRKAKSSGK